MDWLRGRRFFVPNQPLGFEVDGIALLGVSVGIVRFSQVGGGGADPSTDPSADRTDDAAWLAGVLRRSNASASEADEWEAGLLRAALLLLEQHVALRAAEPSGTAEPPIAPTAEGGLVPDLAAALAAKGRITLDDAAERAALRRIVSPDVAIVPPERAIVQRVALRWLMRQGATALPRRATVSDVVGLLTAVPHALKRWPWEQKPKTSRPGALAQRWDLQNEYHVQSLLWTILAPVFPDLVDEEYLRAVGHAHPRVDLAIPSLGLIIEVKYLREATQGAWADIVNEVSADTGLYLSIPSEFTQIVAFVWDNASATNHHAMLLRGLRVLRGVTDAVVVSRPGGWVPPS